MDKMGGVAFADLAWMSGEEISGHDAVPELPAAILARPADKKTRAANEGGAGLNFKRAPS
jgi:hypothetical protein